MDVFGVPGVIRASDAVDELLAGLRSDGSAAETGSVPLFEDAEVASTSLRRPTAGIVVAPVRHEAHGRLTRLSWAAYLTPRGVVGSAAATSDPAAMRCPHSQGHRTTDAAVACGKQMWEGLAS